MYNHLMKLVIQIPCHNEEDSVLEVLKSIPKNYSGIDEVEIFVIDDASSDKTVDIVAKPFVASYNGVNYETSKYVKLGGSASYGKGRYITFSVEGACKVSVMASSSSSSADRIINMVDSSNTVIGTFDALKSVSFSTVDVSEAGTYSIGSAGSGVYVFYIIIEYFE